MLLLNCPCWPHPCYSPASAPHIGRIIEHTVPPWLDIKMLNDQIYNTFSYAVFRRPLSSVTRYHQIFRCHVGGKPSSLIHNSTHEHVLFPSQHASQLTTGVTGHLTWSRVGASRLCSLSQEMKLQPLWCVLDKFVRVCFKPTLFGVLSCVTTVSQKSVRG